MMLGTRTRRPPSRSTSRPATGATSAAVRAEILMEIANAARPQPNSPETGCRKSGNVPIWNGTTLTIIPTAQIAATRHARGESREPATIPLRLGRERRAVRRRIVDGVDQHEDDPADRVAAIDPGVVRAALDQQVARLHMDLALVEQHVDLAAQHDRVVDAPGA